MKAIGRDYFVLVSQRGFTLVEMIVVIVITGIIAAAVAVFIRAPVQGYVDLVARAELADEADTAVRRISREVRRALPNSVRVANDGSYVEFLLTSTGGRYMTDTDNPSLGDVLNFTDENKKSFRVVGGFAADKIIPNHSWIVVYNLGPGQEPANAYCNGDACNNRAKVSQVDAALKTITLVSNPFAVPGSFRSPGNRFQVVTEMVKYACEGGLLKRYSSEPTTAEMPSTEGALLANGVTVCNFSYSDTNIINTSQALLGIQLAMARPGTNSGTITLFHQVHVDNTP